MARDARGLAAPTGWRISLPLPVVKGRIRELPARDRLLLDSQVVVDQPRPLHRARLGEGPLTRLTGPEMAAVEQSLMGVLGLL